MNTKQNRKELADALRSGKYSKGRLNLRTTHDSIGVTYCPFGVACEVYRQSSSQNCYWEVGYKRPITDEMSYSIDIFVTPNNGAASAFPQSFVMEYYGFTTDHMEKIIGMNDKTKGNNFNEIADYIEHEVRGINVHTE